MSAIKLSKDDIAKLRKMQRELGDMLTDLDKLESCEVDCDQLREETVNKVRLAGLMLQHFGGGE